MSALHLKLAAMLAALGLFAGCLGGGGGEVETATDDEEKIDEILGEKGRDDLVDAAAIVPRNFSMPNQKLLPPIEVQFMGTVDTSQLGSYEAERDESGVDYNTVLQTFDISSHLPPGQPAEIVIDLFWDASEANSADLDIFVDVPGTRTTYHQVSETMNWNQVLKTMVVNTVGVPGQPAVIGVQIASAMASEGFDYELSAHFTYVSDVVTPYHAWAFDVPTGATALILSSVKAGGDEHIRSQFVILDPEDRLVRNQMFDDINIPSQSVLIPITKAGTYVFYAYYMHGGFLNVKADVPLDNTQARPLALVEEEVMLTNQPAPGVAGKDYGAGLQSTPTEDDVGAQTFDFAFNDAFPLRVEGYIRGQFVADSKITLASQKGMVHRLTKIATYEDERGTIGYTSDHEGRVIPSADGEPNVEGGLNNLFNYANVDRGAWTASVVNDGPQVEIGYRVVYAKR